MKAAGPLKPAALLEWSVYPQSSFSPVLLRRHDQQVHPHIALATNRAKGIATNGAIGRSERSLLGRLRTEAWPCGRRPPGPPGERRRSVARRLGRRRARDAPCGAAGCDGRLVDR